jgi:hypothetical protein
VGSLLIYWSWHHKWDLTIPIDFLSCYAFLCRLSDPLEDVRNEIGAIDAATAAQRTRDTPWCAPEPPLPPPPPSKRRKLDHGQPTAGPSGGGVADELDFMDALDLEESVEGSCGLSERDSDIVEPEEADEWTERRETKKMPKEGCNAAVYDQLHGLPSDTNWWQSYLG